MKKCEVARNVEINGERFKVVNPKDACAVVNRVLAKHEGQKVITPQEYENLLKTKEVKPGLKEITAQ